MSEHTATLLIWTLGVLTFGMVGGTAVYSVTKLLRDTKASGTPRTRPATSNDAASLARSAEVKSLAEKHGWTFIQRDDAFADRWEQYLPEPGTTSSTPHPLYAGRWTGRRIENIVVGDYHGHPVVAFDIMTISAALPEVWADPMRTKSTEVRHSRKNTTDPTCHSVVMLHTGTAMPFLNVSPENIATRMFAAALGRDYLVESEDFNRRYTVRTTHPRFASDFLHPTLIDDLLARPVQRWEVLGPDLAICEPDSPYTEDTLIERLETLDIILHRIPDHMWRTLTGTVPPFGSTPATPPA